MKIDTFLSYVDDGFVVLPEFQRGYVWNREQVRRFFESLYRRYPVGSLLFWDTAASGLAVRGDVPPAASPVRLLLDGQQRMTTLYGVIRGKPPAFFDGSPETFTGLHFHLDDQVFEFYQPVKMADDPLWIDVTELMSEGPNGVGAYANKFTAEGIPGEQLAEYLTRLSHLLGILDIDIGEDVISGPDKTLDVVVDIFNRVNSGGTKLSTGDLAIARICAQWPEGREVMKAHLSRWEAAGFERFDLDWFLRSVNTILNGEARLQFLERSDVDEVKSGVRRAASPIDAALNLISGRLGLDHGRVVFARNALPVMAHYLDRHGANLPSAEADLLLYWYVQCGMWGKYSGSTETVMDADLETLEEAGAGLSRLMDRLHLAVGTAGISPIHFKASTRNSRFYPVLYLLTRVGGARDFCNGLPLHEALLGKSSALEVHHIFPKSQLRRYGYSSGEINELANFCFLTASCNKSISNRLPERYFPEVQANQPGALASQWIPDSGSKPWTLDRYPEFLAKRRVLLTAAVNDLLTGLRSGELAGTQIATAAMGLPDDETLALAELRHWMVELSLNPGELEFELDAGEQPGGVLLDLAWPRGVQAGLTQPVAVLLDEPSEVAAAASQAGFRYFTSVEAFQRYVRSEILGAEGTAA